MDLFISLVLAGAIVGLIFARRLVAVWVREPIGLGVPLAAIAIVAIAPQMPDMMTALTEGVAADGTEVADWWRALDIPLCGAALGFFGWFWTRAAVNAPFMTDDIVLHPEKAKIANRVVLPWPVRFLPRVAIGLAGFISVSPVLVLWISEGRPPLEIILAVLVGLGANIVILLFVVFWRERFRIVFPHPAPAWMWRTHTTSLLAAAPMGWPSAVLLLAVSLLGGWFVGSRPEWIDRNLHAPAAAMGALALAIGLLSLTLAVLRDVCWAILSLLAIPFSGDFTLRPQARWLGLIALVWLTFFTPAWWERTDRYVLNRTTQVHPEPLLANDRCDDEASSARPCLRRAVRDWYQAKQPFWLSPDPMPLVIVATAGGASRAAVWTLSSMRLLDAQTGGRFGQHLFAISAVSGGALGAGTYVRALAHLERPSSVQGQRTGAVDWTSQAMTDVLRVMAASDLLSPSIATYFLNDTLTPSWGPLWPFSGDRGRVLEGTFERRWHQWFAGHGITLQPNVGFIQLQQRLPPGHPHLLLNGTDRETGRRAITSTIRFPSGDDVFPGAEDLLTKLFTTEEQRSEPNLVERIQATRSQGSSASRVRPPGRLASALDIPLATAVHNAARFPFISPAGRYNPGDARQLLDGGYYENYGARTALELARAIQQLKRADPSLDVLPIVVVISNDADSFADAEALKRMTQSEPESSLDPRLIVNSTMHCNWHAQPLVQDANIRRANGGSGVPQLLAPVAGLYAVRGAHGQDALHALRQEFCPERSARDIMASTRMIHIALPRPDPDRGEAAPMNWVLNRAARKLLLETGPCIGFNQQQGRDLWDTFRTLGRGIEIQPTPGVPSIACGTQQTVTGGR